MSSESKVSRVLPWAVCAGTGLLGLVAGPYVITRGSVYPVAAARLDLRETTVPACGASAVSARSLTVVTLHAPRTEIDRISRMTFRAGEITWEVAKGGTSCTASREDGTTRSDPCLAESCSDGICALRVILDGATVPGSRIEASYGDAAGGTVGRGETSVPAGKVPGPAVLEGERRGRSVAVRAPDHPDGKARITSGRSGRTLADVRLPFDAEGRAKVDVPPDSDLVTVSVADGGNGLVGQSTLKMPGPFDRDCDGTGEGSGGSERQRR